MHWIDERLQQQRDIRTRDHTIRTEAPNIYSAIWDCIERDIKYANSRPEFQGSITTVGNKATRDIVVSRPMVQPYNAPRAIAHEFHFVLTPSDLIEARGGIHILFSVDVCENGVACLKDRDGKEVEVSQAAKAILEPFLFPDLQKS